MRHRFFRRWSELLAKLTVPIPNEHTERLIAKAREHGLYIQSGTMLEEDPKMARRRLQHDVPRRSERHALPVSQGEPVDPLRVHSSPHDLPGYDEPLFPVADTPIGRIGCAICYDWLFPEAIRQLAMNGAEVLVRVSAYMDPWGATEPMNWWTTINRARAIENIAYVVGANQGASLRHYPPYSWPGGSRSSTSTAACWPMHPLDLANASSSRRSTSRACGTSASRGAGITCWRTCGPRRIRSTRSRSTRVRMPT